MRKREPDFFANDPAKISRRRLYEFFAIRHENTLLPHQLAFRAAKAKFFNEETASSVLIARRKKIFSPKRWNGKTCTPLPKPCNVKKDHSTLNDSDRKGLYATGVKAAKALPLSRHDR
ncbi:hypothetical protein [Desulfovibrio sp. ZJ369]|uniref:hypothetical protein n=1 Tax=Desulfovibrio sp. ZJ369 TaxID=2709793 RepID=UPI0013EAA6B7|nr:hypothetical protein [Desulfovibrio sp. ZJ369]